MRVDGLEIERRNRIGAKNVCPGFANCSAGSAAPTKIVRLMMGASTKPGSLTSFGMTDLLLLRMTDLGGCSG